MSSPGPSLRLIGEPEDFLEVLLLGRKSARALKPDSA